MSSSESIQSHSRRGWWGGLMYCTWMSARCSHSLPLFSPFLSVLIQFGRTEVIDNTLNPDFVRKYILDYFFEEKQNLRFDVWVFFLFDPTLWGHKPSGFQMFCSFQSSHWFLFHTRLTCSFLKNLFYPFSISSSLSFSCLLLSVNHSFPSFLLVSCSALLGHSLFVRRLSSH